MAERCAVLGAVPALGVFDAETAVADADVGEGDFAFVGGEEVVETAEDFGGVGVGVVAEGDEVEFTKAGGGGAGEDEGGEDGGNCEDD